VTAPLRVAIIGAGAIGDLRAEAIARCAGLTLAAVADADQARAEALARRYGVEAADGQSAACRPDVQVVIVATPPDSHAEYALAALGAGKHVLVEKPLARSLTEAEAMCAAAERCGVLLKTGFNHRRYPPMAFAHRLIQSGAIGEPIAAQAYAGHPGGREFGHEWVHEAAVTGGGCLVDNGIHILDLVRYLFGEVERAVGYTANLIWPFEAAEDNAVGLFRAAGGQVAQVHASWTDWKGYRFWVQVTGTRGYMRAVYPPMLVEWGQTPGPGIRAKRRFEVFPAMQVQERLRTWRWTMVNSFVEELTDFAAAIQAGRESPATGRDGLRALQMAHAVYRSAREGREVEA
jgi:predicted dehydrogenase